jgi:acyl-coenzyme A thioesterase PaaI-like protein
VEASGKDNWKEVPTGEGGATHGTFLVTSLDVAGFYLRWVEIPSMAEFSGTHLSFQHLGSIDRRIVSSRPAWVA